jgi:nucleoside-diphosphate-sugar epimerase
MLPIFQWMARGIALVPGSPAARMSLIHAEDLVAATTQVLETPATRGQIFYACDGKAQGYSWPELAAAAESLWSRKVRIWQVPQWLLNGVAHSNMLLSAVSGNAPMLTPPKLRELRHQDWVVDNSAISATTGWQPEIGLQAGLETLGIAVK